MAPGERVLVVRDLGFQTGQRVVGSFADGTRLNNAGETITLVDAAGEVIHSFTYDDALPWPTEADGQGRSLVLSDSDEWGASAAVGGSPGLPEVEAETLEAAILQSRPSIDAGRLVFGYRYVDGFRIEVEQSADLESWSVVGPGCVRPGAEAGSYEMPFPLDAGVVYLRLRLTEE